MTRELHTKGLQTHERKSLARVGHWCGDSGGSRCGMLVSAHPPRSDLSRVRGPQNMLRHPQFLERVLKSRIRACRSFWTAHVLAAATLLLPLGIRRVLYWGGWYRRRFGVLPLRSLNGGAGLGSVTDDGHLYGALLDGRPRPYFGTIRQWHAVAVGPRRSGFAFAKVAEHFDAAMYDTTGIVSGHSLKHVLGALAVLWAVFAVLRCRRGRSQSDDGKNL